ncbi:NAD(P)-dependent oxidoreductase [Candidatus Daviesbacteria bacterium]|nr:NAD(P)-dependent oxidoreductase [Candidatus Daviesbacteria bacterium]
MIVITGANGFVGQKLAPLALNYFKPSDILCLIHNENSHLEKRGIKILKKFGLKTLEVDLVTGKNLDFVPKSPEFVIHLAANTDTSKSDHRVNDIGTKNLLAVLSGIGPKTHFIYTGTTVLMSGRVKCHKPFSEKDRANPTNEYGRTKLRAEKILQEACQEKKFSLTIARLNTVYGGDPREHKMFKVLEKDIKKSKFTTRLNWPGKTSIVHVDDVAKALLMLLKKPPKPGQSELVLLSAESPTFSEIIKVMHEKMGYSYKPINLPAFFWKLLSNNRKFILYLEKITPPSLYNLFWRLGLIVDDVIWCESINVPRKLSNWNPKKIIEVEKF